MHQDKQLVVLVAPLDWGLGHATRCIPIIKELKKHRATVLIAATGAQKNLLETEFPELEFVESPSYLIRYKKGFFLKWAVFLQIPSLLKRIKNENRWLNDLLDKRKIDILISDNRYGLYNSNLISVFITHQIYIHSGINKIIDRIILRWNNRLLQRFSRCWIPDQKNEFSIAGKLSDSPFPTSIPIKYIGILSRFVYQSAIPVQNSLLILISGPEPQRTDFEKILMDQVRDIEMKVIMVRGLPETAPSVPVLEKNLTIYNHLDANQLNAVINSSQFIIARGGYSTIMDLIKLNRNAILVPTPGQPEQEYLTTHLHEKKWMYMVRQKNFNLKLALVKFQAGHFLHPVLEESLLPEAVQSLLSLFVLHEE